MENVERTTGLIIGLRRPNLGPSNKSGLNQVRLNTSTARPELGPQVLGGLSSSECYWILPREVA